MMTFLCLWFSFFSYTYGYGSDTAQSWNLYLENDSRLFGGPGTDDNYSSGIKVSYNYGAERDYIWNPFSEWFLGVMGYEGLNLVRNYSVSFGHQIYTPKDITETKLIENDRPYAGWVYLSFSAAFKYEKMLYVWDLNLGIVGPAAQGEEVQKKVHKLIGSKQPKGWDHQIKNEFTAQLSFRQRYHFIESDIANTKFFDVIPFWGGSVGNVFVYAEAGVMARLGYNVPQDFGPTRPSASDSDSLLSSEVVKENDFSFFLFSSVRGTGNPRNLFLDGNTFRDSHRVSRIPYVGEIEAGFVLGVYGVEVSWRTVRRSAEFKQQNKNHGFVSMNLSYKFD